MQRDTDGMHSSVDEIRYQMQHGHLQQPGRQPDTTTAADARDQEPGMEQLGMELPITYMPFKFENRRVRIDWRLLHGVDLDKLVRDTDLDTLEQLVTCVTWGDIEAEDTRHLSEGNFVKVFRLAQLLLEYLLYVQENLKYTNSVLDRNRTAAVVHARSLSTRCRDLYNQLKTYKRELKRAHKTVKTFELMAAAVGGAAAAAQAATAAAAATPSKQDAAPQQPQTQQQAPQQQGSVMTAGEVLLHQQLSELTERLTLAVCEAERLRTERQELQYQIRHLHDTLAAKLSGRGGSSIGGGGSRAREAAAAAAEAATAAAVAVAQQEQQQLFMAELQCAQAQIQELQAHNKELKAQLVQQSGAVSSASAAESAVEELSAKVEEQARELARLQSELREKEASISVFQTTNATLQQQLDALQRQLASPEATTPSFVAKQRQQLAAAASVQAGLQSENTKLRQELLELRLALEAGGMGARAASGGGSVGKGRREQDGEEDALAAAERMLSGDDGGGDAPDGGAGDWKVHEIERLQDENRQLQDKVASLQEALYGLEAANARLEKWLAAAQAAGYNLPASAQSSPSAAANSVAAAAAAMAAGLSGAMGSSGWASVSSSGPAAELTAADLATGAAGSRPGTAAAAPAATAAADTATAVNSVTLEQSQGSVDGDATAAAAAAGAAVSGAHEAAVLLIKAGGAAAAAAEDAGKGLLARSGLNITDGGASEGGRITAYRPSRGDTAGGAPEEHVQGGSAVQSANASSNGVSSAAASSNGVGSSSSAAASSNGVGGPTAAAGPARGAIDQAAAQQLRALVAEMQAEMTPEQVAAEYAEVCCDWDKPFDLTDEEKGQFRQVVPLEVTGLKDVLCSNPHTAEEVSASKPGMLSAINRILDGQLASYGIHPGRTGLSEVELLAAMKMLTERREAFEAKLTPEQRSDVEIVRLGLLLHPYHALQSVMGTLPEGPEGKKRLPAVTPTLASAVRPPASSLPPAPPPIRLQPRAQQSPVGSNAGFGPASTAGAAAAAAAPMTLYASTGSAGASPSPPASVRYGLAGPGGAPGEVSDSEDGHSPVKRQELYSTFTYHAAAGGVGGSGSGTNGVVRPGGGSSGGGYVRAPSPLGTEAAREAIAKAAASGSFSPMSAALHAKQQLLGSPGGSAGGGGRSVSPGSSPVKQQQQQQMAGPAAGVVLLSPTGVTAPAATAAAAVQQQQQVSAAAALATKQYLGVTSFEDSDEF